jgi:large subunit ribosomal protein L24
MANKLHVRRGDSVVVVAGKDKGKEGEVIKVFPEEQRVLVRGVNVMKKHTKQSAANPQGGIVQKEASIHVSNVMHRDPESGKPTRMGHKMLKDGSKIRFAKKSGSTIDNN